MKSYMRLFSDIPKGHPSPPDPPPRKLLYNILSDMDLEILLCNRAMHARRYKELIERGDRAVAHKPRRI